MLIQKFKDESYSNNEVSIFEKNAKILELPAANNLTFFNRSKYHIPFLTRVSNMKDPETLFQYLIRN